MLNSLVSMIDRTLRARQEIFEYSNCSQCVFRVQLAAAEREIALADGTRLPRGSRLLGLHIWNEHVPPFPAQGPTVGWARRMCRDVELSLEELAAFVAGNPALDDVAAVGGKVMFGSTEQTELVGHVAERYGFVRAVDAEPDHSVAQKLHRLGENILISMIVISHNPAALRSDFLRRERVPVYLRRGELLRRFGTRENIRAAH